MLENVGKIFKVIASIAVLALTPIYLYLVYSKLGNANAFSYAIMMVLTLTIYLPIQVIAKEKGIKTIFSEVFGDEDIQKLISYTFGIIILFLLAKHVNGGEFLVMLFLIYVIWGVLYDYVFNIYLEAGFINKLKFLFLFTILVGLVSFNILTTQYTGAMSWIDIGINIIIFLFTMLFLLPRFTKVIFKRIFKIASHSEDMTIEGVYKSIFALMCVYALIILPIIMSINNVMNNMGAHNIAFYSVYGFIFISTFGAYYQLKLFWSFFLEEGISIILSVVSAMSFVIFLLIMINTGDLVNKKEENIRSAQGNLQKIIDYK